MARSRVLPGSLRKGVGVVCMTTAFGLFACGDDEGGTDGSGRGGSGGEGASGAGAGRPSSGGATSGGAPSSRGGAPAEGGASPGGAPAEGGAAQGGAAAEGGADAGGEAGVGGEGGQQGRQNTRKLNGPNGTLISLVNDLRGLTYAADGKIYASGHVGANITYPAAVDRMVAVVRFNADGTLDTSFDGDGIKTLNLRTRIAVDEAVTNDGDEGSIGIVELANGDIVVQANVRDLGGRGRDVVLLRLNRHGAPVASFGTGGVRKLDFGWSDADNAAWPTATSAPADDSWGIALDRSGDVEKIVVFAHGSAKRDPLLEDPLLQRTDNDRYVTRVLASTGAIDPEFNGGEVFTFNTEGVLPDNARRGIVEEDGSIVSSGYTNFGPGLGNHVVIARLLPDGAPDESFGFGVPALPGVAIANPFLDDGGVTEVYQIGKQSSGRYVTTGYGRATAADTASSYDFATTLEVDLVSVGLLPGALDPAYGVEGANAIQSELLALGNTEDRGRDLVVLEDDRVVHAGRLGPNPALFVTTEDGEPDASLGGVGEGPNGDDTVAGAFGVAALPGTTSHFYAVAVSKDGTRVAATTNNHSAGVVLTILDVSP